MPHYLNKPLCKRFQIVIKNKNIWINNCEDTKKNFSCARNNIKLIILITHCFSKDHKLFYHLHDSSYASWYNSNGCAYACILDVGAVNLVRFRHIRQLDKCIDANCSFRTYHYVTSHGLKIRVLCEVVAWPGEWKTITNACKTN